MAKPSFPFYPDDWMNDLGLRGCCPSTRAIWMDMLCLMHQGEPYGHLADKAGPLPMKFVATRCGVTPRQFGIALSELETRQIFSRTDTGLIFSRRMVRDEYNRNIRAQGGAKSLICQSVPRPKGILPGVAKGILPDGGVKDTFSPEEVKDNTPLSIYKPSEVSFEEVKITWDWYKAEYPGDVNEFTELRLFMGIMATSEDLAALRENLPQWKLTQKWLDGFFPSSENFLSKRMFKITPKQREAVTGLVRTKQQQNSDLWSQA